MFPFYVLFPSSLLSCYIEFNYRSFILFCFCVPPRSVIGRKLIAESGGFSLFVVYWNIAVMSEGEVFDLWAGNWTLIRWWKMHLAQMWENVRSDTSAVGRWWQGHFNVDSVQPGTSRTVEKRNWQVDRNLKENWPNKKHSHHTNLWRSNCI